MINIHPKFIVSCLKLTVKIHSFTLDFYNVALNIINYIVTEKIVITIVVGIVTVRLNFS